jgi:L-ascorbate metabolism protein UlaG (beta-lactamase superfamily)
MVIRWLGHATTLVAVDGVRLLTDPVLGRRAGPLVRIAPPAGARAIGRVDAVLLSHLHADHADLPSLRRLGPATPILAPRGAARWLHRAGLASVVELTAGAEASIGGVRVIATEARHPGRRWPLGPVCDPVGYLVEGGRAAYFAGDTDLFGAMAELRGRVDVALLPVWGWGRSLGPEHLDPGGAATAATMIAPRVAIPIHWGTLAVGRPWRAPADPGGPPRRFAALTREQAPGVEVRVLAPGETTVL